MFIILKTHDIKTRIYFSICILLFIAIATCIFFGERSSHQRKKKLLSLSENYLQSNPTNAVQNETPSNVPSTGPTEKTEDTKPEQPSAAPPLPNNDTILLKPGDKGAEVINLQKKLYEIGCNITVDGIYGNQVVNTLKTIQTENKLNISGNYTVETKNVLDKIKNVRTYKKP